VQIDCGHSSLRGCGLTGPMVALIEGEGYTVTLTSSSTGGLTSIPANVKVLFLWLPGTPYSVAEVNTLKAFAAEGGRIVFNGEHDGFYGSQIDPVENDLLRKMGAQLKNVRLALTPPIGPSEVRAHQVTTGVTGFTFAATSTLLPGVNDFPLFVDTSGNVLAGVAKIDVTPLPTGAPALTSLSPSVVGSTSPSPQSVTLTVRGTNFVPGLPGTSVQMTDSVGGQVTVASVVYVNSTELSVTFNLSSGLSSGSPAFTVSTENGTSNSLSFTVVAP
jgi:hypothetical protein